MEHIVCTKDATAASTVFVSDSPHSDSVMFGRLAKNPGEVEFRHLDIVFSPQRVVQRYHYSTGTERVRSSFSHLEVGNAVIGEKLACLIKGKTTRVEVVELFGAPLTEGLNIDGQLVLSWLCTRVGPLGSRDMQSLAVVLDREEKVEDYRIREHTR